MLGGGLIKDLNNLNQMDSNLDYMMEELGISKKEIKKSPTKKSLRSPAKNRYEENYMDLSTAEEKQIRLDTLVNRTPL